MNTTSGDERFGSLVGGISSSTARSREIQPVHYWALIGFGMCVFMAYILTEWVTGPYFVPTPPGPTAQPGWMRPMQLAFQGIQWLIVLYFWYRLIWKPWRTERRLSTDGAFLIAFMTMYFQDQFSQAGGYWYTYNAYVFNMGSWFPLIPGWTSFAQPGQAVPILPFMMLPGYIFYFFLSMLLGVAMMRKLKSRWNFLSTPVLFFAVFLVMAIVDIVIEVGIWMPLGFYAYNSGGFLPMISKGDVHQFPVVEALATGIVTTAFVALRYYTDDKGMTVAERGLEKVRSGPMRLALLRLFALIAMVQLIFFFVYNVPMYSVGSTARDWPKSIQERSYLTNGICGAGTPRGCPTADTPRVTNSPHAISISPEGKLVVPEGASLPSAVPFIAGP